ncbi:Innexin inx1, partial [Pseudolycoriella hygida]
AVACYTPKFLWDMFEGGLLRTIVMGLNLGICREEEKKAKKAVLLGYLRNHMNRHKMYAIRYWMCESLCLVNIIAQMWLMNKFFDGEFMSYGWNIMNYSETPQEQRVDPMVYVFPRITKCIFHKYGASGSIQKHDSLCLLPLNIVNEKTYIFIWFWYIALIIMLVGLIIYRAMIIMLPRVRAQILNARNRMVPRDVAFAISKYLDIGDWWLVYMLGRNLDPIIYRDVLSQLAEDIPEEDKKDEHNWLWSDELLGDDGGWSDY